MNVAEPAPQDWGTSKKSKSWSDESWGGGSNSSYDYGSIGVSKKTDELPTIIGISVNPTSRLVLQGYPTDVAAIEYSKSMSIFSDANYILGSFFEGGDATGHCTFEHDPESTTYPEVYQAWKAAGQEDSMPTIGQ